MSTGAKTLEGKHRQKMASWKHGMFSKEAKEKMHLLRRILYNAQQNLDF
jgi:hypothetical protein